MRQVGMRSYRMLMASELFYNDNDGRHSTGDA